MQKFQTASCRNSQSESEDATSIHKSLQELKELRSQLHQAADYCEATFLDSQQKGIVLDNTRNYICRELVTVVDHLGSVSSKLDCSISKTDAFSEAEFRISCLKQRLLSCEQYVHKLNLPGARWNVNLPQFNRRYLLAPTAVADISDGNVSSPAAPPGVFGKLKLDAEDLPLFLYTYTPKPPLRWSSKHQSPETSTDKPDCNPSAIVLPVRDGFSARSKSSSPTFHFQQRTQKHGRYTVFRKSAHNNDILSIIRLGRRLT